MYIVDIDCVCIVDIHSIIDIYCRRVKITPSKCCSFLVVGQPGSFDPCRDL